MKFMYFLRQPQESLARQNSAIFYMFFHITGLDSGEDKQYRYDIVSVGSKRLHVNCTSSWRFREGASVSGRFSLRPDRDSH